MAKDYSQRLPVDRDGNHMPESPPPVLSLAEVVRGNGAASSTFGLTQNTTVVQVTTAGSPAAVKWGTSVIGVSIAEATPDYDVIVPANSQLLLVVPRFQAGIANWNANQGPSILGMNRSEGLYTHMALTTGVIASVFVAEY